MMLPALRGNVLLVCATSVLCSAVVNAAKCSGTPPPVF